MAHERLDKMVASRGALSRREACQQIRAGCVTVNGVVCRDPTEKADLEQDSVCLMGIPLRTRKERYFILNKPAGVISATQDAKQKTVLELFPVAERAGLAPVGRLDKDTVGLLLMTDDGMLNHALTAPRRQIDKRYRALVSGTLADNAAEQFAAGLVLRDGTKCRPAELIVMKQQTGELTEVEVVVHEGKYHQVKRMIAALGGHVEMLERLSMGPLALDADLERGAYRSLTEIELQALFTACDVSRIGF